MWRGKHRITRQEVAVKAIQMKVSSDNDSAVYNEAKILYRCVHPFIIRCIEVFEVDSKMYVISEFCKFGDLQQYQKRICNGQLMEEEQIKVIANKIAQGVNYLHESGIVHRDLKLENILVDEKLGIVIPIITDFGFAKSVGKERRCRTICGSNGSMAPEILRKEPYGMEVDVWAFGVLVYRLV